MASKNTVDPEGDDSLGVLDDTPSSDTTGIGLHGGTAQVSVEMPTGADDDDLVEDETVDGEIGSPEIVSDLILDTSGVADADVLARIDQQSPEIVIELPADQFPTPAAVEPDTDAIEPVVQEAAEADEIPVVTSEIIVETEDVETEDVETEDVESEDVEVEDIEAEDIEAEDVRTEASDETAEVDAEDAEELASVDAVDTAEPDEPEPVSAPVASDADQPEAAQPEAAQPEAAQQEAVEAEHEDEASETLRPVAEAEVVEDQDDEYQDDEPEHAEAEPSETEPAAVAESAAAAADAADAAVTGTSDSAPAARPAEPVGPEAASEPSSDLEAAELARLESVVAAAKAQLRDAMAPIPQKQNDAPPTPAEPAEESTPVVNEDRAPQARAASEIARTREEAPRASTEVSLTAKRLDDLGSAGRESADLLTADRLLEPSRMTKPEPEGTWSHLLYAISGGRINVGDSRKARERKQLNARIAAPMPGTARFVPVLSRKGGVGKTTVTALLGMALADARDDRVIAVDANPDRGTLAERVVGSAAKSVRDMVRAQHDIRGFHDISALVARDHTRLDVLASDADPRVSEAFGDADYRDVAAVAAQYYSLVLTDSGTGIVHSVMGATLDLADQIVIVSGLSVDEARLASETLTWLETNGYADLARGAIVVLNQSTPGAPLVRLSELESHFSTRAKHVLRIPYDTQIAGGGPIDFSSLQPATRQAAREIAATLVEGLRAQAA